jgi:IclR family transcriptional regulator, KDG regulon repressor
MVNKKNNYINQSVVYAFQILECFNENMPSYTAGQLTEQLKMNPSSTWRLIYTLEHMGYLSKINSDQYQLGFKNLNFARIIINNLHIRKIAKPFLETFSKEVNFNISLGILDRDEVVYLERIHSSDTPDIYFHIGRRVPIYCTALGKVLLAFQSIKYQEEIINNMTIKKFTKNTITDKQLLKKELKNIHKDGYAVDNSEYIKSVKCLAMPIHDHTGEVVASVSISNRYLTNKFENNILEYLDILSNTVKKISNGMGYSTFNPF